MTAAATVPVGEAMPRQRTKVVYLDQNKWIDLARAVRSPKDHSFDREVLELLCEKIEAGAVKVPLAASDLYETHKVNLRALIAETQATLSRSEVFRGRHRRLEVEIGRVLSQIYGLPWAEPDPDWVFSTLYFEAHAELGDPNLVKVSDRVLAVYRSNPPGALFDYLANLDDATRRQAVARFEEGSERLRADIEARRAEHRGESLSMRRRIYGVLMVLGDQAIMIAVADQLGLSWRCFADNKGATMRRVINEAPAFQVEREISLKLEEQPRPLHVNDMRDMRNFTTVLPYADVVIAEKQFINLARQAGLASKYEVRLETELRVLLQLL